MCCAIRGCEVVRERLFVCASEVFYCTQRPPSLMPRPIIFESTGIGICLQRVCVFFRGAVLGGGRGSSREADDRH